MNYAYPAVLTYNAEFCVYVISFYDLDLYVENESVDMAYLNAKSYLENYLACAIKFGIDINKPSSLEKTREKFKNADAVIMVEAQLDEVKIKKFNT